MPGHIPLSTNQPLAQPQASVYTYTSPTTGSHLSVFLFNHQLRYLDRSKAARRPRLALKQFSIPFFISTCSRLALVGWDGLRHMEELACEVVLRSVYATI